MLNGNDTERARAALHAIPADLPRPDWVQVGMAAHAAGLPFEDWRDWSAQAESYNAQACRATWRSFKDGKGIGAGTLFARAREHGWQDSDKRPSAPKPLARPIEVPAKPRAGMGATEIWNRCEAATNAQPYIIKKQAAGVPLDNLRVVPDGDPLTLLGERMAGGLVVPIIRPDGSFSGLQVIAPPDAAHRLKANEKTDKPIPPGHAVQGWFTVGELVPGGVAYICEGIGQAWACWQATGAAAVVCFGAGNMGKVAKALRAQDARARLAGARRGQRDRSPEDCRRRCRNGGRNA